MNRLISKSAGRFTLIELLVVISIIAILASMLLPALNNTRGKARQVACTVKMKQVYLAYFMYTSDWDDHHPLTVDTGAGFWALYWPFRLILDGYISGEFIYQGWEKRLSTPFHCPSETGREPYGFHDSTVPNSGGYWHGTTYGRNYMIEYNPWNFTHHYRRTGSITQSHEQTYLFMDSASGDPDVDAEWCNPVYGKVAHRHNGGFNVTFVDGHAEGQRYMPPDWTAKPWWTGDSSTYP